MCSRGMRININDKHVLIVYCMPGIVPDSFHVPTLFIPIQPFKIDIIFLIIFSDRITG